MPPRHCSLFSPSQALRQVFLAHLETTPMARAAASAATPFLSPRLLFSTSSRQLRVMGPKPTKPKPQNKFNRLPSDNAIPYKWVRVAEPGVVGLPLDPDSSAALSAPQRTSELLRSLNRQKYSLVLVNVPAARPSPDEGEDGEGNEALTLGSMTEGDVAARGAKERLPICRIIDKQAHAAAAADKAKAARTKELKRKEMELNWAIAPNDLAYKLRQLRDFLAKGKRVELMLAKKRHGRAATRDEGDELLAKLREAAEEAGGKEVKIEGRFPGVVRVVFEGP
ncbi:hypothetical protein JX266_004889 [Neoarthrinium moseri]|nr:hypothetical protein JX266_004889 [Neoarthrinium moseri]